MIKSVLFIGVFGFALATQAAVFRLHLSQEPASLEPWAQKTSGGAYLLSQVFGTLLKFQDGKLVPSLAEKCTFKTPLVLECRLQKNLKFSDDSPLVAADFERTLKDYVSPANKAFRADLLFSVRNAEEYYSGKATRDQVGIRSKGTRTLIFELKQADPEFPYNLTSHLLTALKTPPPKQSLSTWPTSGTYKFVSWEPRKKITLQKRNDPQVVVEFLFLSEETVALNLYRTGELQFVRRLPTLFIPEFRGKPDYHEIDQIRFDYIGFSPQMQAYPNFRKALVRALEYSEIDKVLFTKGSYGCPGLAKQDLATVPCHEFNLAEAKKLISISREKEKVPAALKLGFSKQGGDDIKRTMEWMQSEWQRKLGVSVNLEQVDNPLFVERIKKNEYPIFRKGIAPERPTCLSALETLTPGSNEDYLQVRDPQYLKLFEKLKKSVLRSSSKLKQQKACTEIVGYLLDQAYIIPTGPIFWSILVSPKWTGWQINSLNQLDLSNLREQPTLR